MFKIYIKVITLSDDFIQNDYIYNVIYINQTTKQSIWRELICLNGTA